MQNVRTAQREISRRRYAAAARRWLVLLLVLALATSGLLHALEGDHAAAAAIYAQEVVSVSAGAEACDEPCCEEHSGQPHGTICSMAGSCSLCAPLSGIALVVLSDAQPAGLMPEAVHSGRNQSPHIRPPKLLLNA